jgi:hypothetical protein
MATKPRLTSRAIAALLALSFAATAAHAATFGAPVNVRDNGGSEPGIKVAPDGTLYIFAATSLVIGQVPPSVSAIYRSDDGGNTWVTTPLGLRQAAIGGGDIDLAVAPDNGTISTTDLWLGSASVATSSDKGNTWLASPFNGLFVEDRQWVAAVGGGRVYHVVHQIPAGDIVSISVNSGLLYPIHTLGASPLDQTGCICAPGNIVAENGGLLGDRIAFVFPTTTSGVGLARSTNGGLTWTVTYPGISVNAGAMTGFPSIADDGAGHLAIVWQPAGNGGFYLVKSSDFGNTWSAPQLVESTGTSLYPWVAYRNGKIAVSYYHTTTAASIADDVGPNATWTISYKDSSDNFATRTDIDTVKSGPICTQGINCSADREVGDFQEVAIDGAGKSVVTYNAVLPGNTQVRFAKQQ